MPRKMVDAKQKAVNVAPEACETVVRVPFAPNVFSPRP